MGHVRLKCWLVAAADLLGGLAAFLCCRLTPPVWEARATVLTQGAAAQALPGVVCDGGFAGHIRELTDFSGTLSAKAIPGTNLVALSARDETQSHAAAGLDAALDRLDAVMPWVGECTLEPVLILDPIALPRTGSAGTYLSAALAAGLLAALLLFPLPKREEPLDLWDLLRRWRKLARRRLMSLFLLCLILGGGNYLREKRCYAPSFTASCLVSIGQYSPDTAKALSATVSGLVDSDLMAVPGVAAAAVGQSNLFVFSAAGDTGKAAEAALTAAMARWPELAAYADRELTLLQRQPVEITPPPPFQPLAAWGKGIGLGAIFWAVLLFLPLLIPPEILTPPPAKRIMNPKVKEGSP